MLEPEPGPVKTRHVGLADWASDLTPDTAGGELVTGPLNRTL